MATWTRAALAAALAVAVLGVALTVTRAGEGPVPRRLPEPPASPTDAPYQAADPQLLLVVGDPDLTAAEREVEAALRELGFAVEVVDDEAATVGREDGAAVVVVSKSVDSVQIADTFLRTPGGVVFWEDNAQVIEQDGEQEGEPGTGTPGLATAALVNPAETAWHAEETEVHVDPDAPEELRAGLEGAVTLYSEPGEMTFAPVDDGAPTIAESAIGVAELAHEGNGRYVYYAIEAGAGLADGTSSHGRRVFFGLYDETFPLLTADGRALFDGAVLWAAGRAGEGAR